MTPSTILLLLWLTDWLLVSAMVIYIVKNMPGNDSLLWDMEDQLPVLIAALLIAWPVVLIRLAKVLLPMAWRELRVVVPDKLT